MSWRDNLRPASFRGVSFYIAEVQIGAGRRLARHEYPQRDLPYLEDMGRKAREYKIEAYVLGADYMVGRDALLAAIEKPGPGQFVHPWHGTLVAVVQDCSLTESTQSGGYAKFSLTFVEAGKREAPSVRVDTAGQLKAAKSRLKSTMESVYAKVVDFTSVPMSVVKDAMDTLSELRDVAGVAQAIAGGSYASAISILSATNAGAALADPVAAVRGFVSLADSVADVAGLLAFDRPSLPAATPTAVKRNAYRAQMTLAVRQAAVMRRVDDVLSAEYATVSDARLAREEIVALVDTVLLHPDLDQVAAQAVLDHRTAALAHLQAMVPQLPILFDAPNRRVRPAIVVAHEHYGDDWWRYGKDAVLVARNGVRHPGMVPAITLQLEAVRAS